MEKASEGKILRRNIFFIFVFYIYTLCAIVYKHYSQRRYKYDLDVCFRLKLQFIPYVGYAGERGVCHRSAESGGRFHGIHRYRRPGFRGDDEVLDAYKGPGTSSCPSPGEWAAQFEKADRVIAVTISSSLSGSYSSAVSAARMVTEEHPEKKIHVVDSLSTAGEMVFILQAAIDAIREGCDFEEVAARAEAVKEKSALLFVLSSFENLVKNGRMNRLSGFVAGRLGLRAIGRASEEGTIDVFAKARGELHAINAIVEELENSGYLGGPLRIDHVLNEAGAHMLRLAIHKKWPRAAVTIGRCGGLCSFYAQRSGLMIAYRKG